MRARTMVGIEQAARLKGRKRQSVRYDATQWKRVIQAQRQSPLTVVEFCRRRRIAKATFWYWRKRLVTTKHTRAMHDRGRGRQDPERVHHGAQLEANV